jgi:DNA-binding NarL/FixJ family response regulator
MPPRILIVDDHEIVRVGIRTLLNGSRPQWEICGEATSGKEAIEAAAALAPDVIILDVTMPGMSGIETASRITNLGLRSMTLIFTMHESATLVTEVRASGARGYVAKSQASRDLVLAIESLLAGGSFYGEAESEASAKKAAGPDPGMTFSLAFTRMIPKAAF